MRFGITALSTLAVVLAVTAPGAAAAPSADSGYRAHSQPHANGTITTERYTGTAGSREFQVYRPRAHRPGQPLMIWLHGASKVLNGDPRELRRTSTLLTEADRRGYSVVAAMQSLSVDPSGTWRVFDPANLIRGQGETSIIAGIVRRSVRELRADPSRVYVVGHSAGGAMTQNVVALYPDLFAGAATSASVPFAADPTGALTRAPRQGKPIPMFVVQADKDSLVPLFVSTLSIGAALNVNGIRGAHPAVSRLRATSSDRYPTVLERYGAGRREVVSATVIGADHPTGPGGVTVNGPALDRKVITFLLSHRR